MTATEYLWVQFNVDYETVLNTDTWNTQAGLPHCVYERLKNMKFDQL